MLTMTMNNLGSRDTVVTAAEASVGFAARKLKIGMNDRLVSIQLNNKTTPVYGEIQARFDEGQWAQIGDLSFLEANNGYVWQFPAFRKAGMKQMEIRSIYWKPTTGDKLSTDVVVSTEDE